MTQTQPPHSWRLTGQTLPVFLSGLSSVDTPACETPALEKRMFLNVADERLAIEEARSLPKISLSGLAVREVRENLERIERTFRSLK